jgi:CheY-specific phosphatase CheX
MNCSVNDTSQISLEFLRDELSEAFTRVWKTSLDLSLKLANVAIAQRTTLPWLGAVAWIGGSWTGNVRIGMPKELALIIAARQIEMKNPSERQIKDALRELANMIAGNLKSVLPGRCGLATPGNFEIKSLEEIQDEFSPILLNWYESEDFAFFLSLSAL